MTLVPPTAGSPTAGAPTAGAPSSAADDALQALCEQGSDLLVRTRYLEAEAALVPAEEQAWASRDWDTLSRLYMPLQEARRQRRQRCGDGTVKLDWVAQSPYEGIDAATVLQAQPNGQMLVAAWGTIGPAADLRRLAAEQGLYAETFLAAVYPVADPVAPNEMSRVVVIAPLPDAPLPDAATAQPPEELPKLLPPGCLVLRPDELPAGQRKGTTQTYAEVMALWERLHRPFLAAADAEPDPVRRMELYRTTIRVDYACEFAHQRLSNVAKELARG